MLEPPIWKFFLSHWGITQIRCCAISHKEDNGHIKVWKFTNFDFTKESFQTQVVAYEDKGRLTSPVEKIEW